VYIIRYSQGKYEECFIHILAAAVPQKLLPGYPPSMMGEDLTGAVVLTGH